MFLVITACHAFRRLLLAWRAYRSWTLCRVCVLGLQLSPLLDLIGVVFQMGTYDALHKAREVGASISQSTDNEVGALLSCPTQIDCPTFDQLQEIFIEVRRSKTLVGEISVGVRRSKTLVGEISVGVRRLKILVREISVGVRRLKTLVREISVGVRRLKTLVREISVGVRRLKVPALGLIANLTRLPCASATALGIVDPQVLLGVYLEAGVAFIPQW